MIFRSQLQSSKLLSLIQPVARNGTILHNKPIFTDTTCSSMQLNYTKYQCMIKTKINNECYIPPAKHACVQVIQVLSIKQCIILELAHNCVENMKYHSCYFVICHLWLFMSCTLKVSSTVTCTQVCRRPVCMQYKLIRNSNVCMHVRFDAKYFLKQSNYCFLHACKIFQKVSYTPKIIHT